MDLELKTVSFGGYDKKAVETYISEMQEGYEKQIAQLKETTVKLGETVDSLRKMREVNMNESKANVDNLKDANTSLRSEIEVLREKLADYEANEQEYKDKYESVSKVALDAQMRADRLVRDTENECTAKRNEVAAELEKMMQETHDQCEELKNTTTAECDRLRSETEASCSELKATTESECERQRASTSYDCANQKLNTETYCENLKSSTESECEKMKAEAEAECDEMKQKTREEVHTTRSQVKRECESISEFVSQLQESVENVASAVKKTKELTDGAFGDLN